jgi:glycosyltransferase involved in cell wall biosynthesis
MRVVGISLVKDEDLFVEQAVRNALGFCDEFLAVDNGSRDGTAEILGRLSRETGGQVIYHRVDHPRVSHDLVAPLAGTDTWIFGVDGDEIYDPEGLRRMRARMEAGAFDRDWVIFGNVLNVRRLDAESRTATGHLAPPCRSMTKLYNFRAIDAWHGPCHERLHGGRPVFREGFHEGLRRNLHESVPWDDADFRCLHLCFLRRSTTEAEAIKPRPNIMDHYAKSWRQRADDLWRRVRGLEPVDWKGQRYGRGPMVTRSLDPFFPGRGP